MEVSRLIAEGRRTVERFDQDKVWDAAYGERHFITDLEDDHLNNIIRFLERRAKRIAFLYGYGVTAYPGPSEWTQAYQTYEQELQELWERQVREPLKWLRDTKLMKALYSEQKRRRETRIEIEQDRDRLLQAARSTAGPGDPESRLVAYRIDQSNGQIYLAAPSEVTPLYGKISDFGREET